MDDKAKLALFDELVAALAAHAYPTVYAERNARISQMEADRDLLERCGYRVRP